SLSKRLRRHSPRTAVIRVQPTIEKDSGKSREKTPKRSTPPSTTTCQTRASCFMAQTSRYPCYEHRLEKMDSLKTRTSRARPLPSAPPPQEPSEEEQTG